MERPVPDPRALVREDAVNARVYTDPGIFDLEMDRLFGRAWLLAGHESQVPDPGSYATMRLGREPVVMIRGTDGAVRVFHNRCPHRGARLCSLASGRSPTLVCPYHGWTFDPDGGLRSVPAPAEYPPAFDPAAHGLRPVARTEAYRGFVFASLAADGPDLASYLGHMRTSIDDLVDRAPADAVEAAPTVVRHRYAGNWKLTFENLNDTLHAGVAHALAAKAARTVAADLPPDRMHPVLGMMMANAKPLSFFQKLRLVTAAHGHSYFGAHMPGGYQGPDADAYREALAQARGPERAEEILSVDRHLTLLYPGSTWHGRFQTVRIVQPLRVDLTEVVAFVFRLKGAPEGIFESALHYCNASSSALSSVITDDLEIYEGTQRSNAADPGAWLPLSRGIGAAAAGPDGTGAHPATSEAFIRNQYAAWAAALAGEDLR